MTLTATTAATAADATDISNAIAQNVLTADTTDIVTDRAAALMIETTIRTQAALTETEAEIEAETEAETEAEAEAGMTDARNMILATENMTEAETTDVRGTILVTEASNVALVTARRPEIPESNAFVLLATPR